MRPIALPIYCIDVSSFNGSISALSCPLFLYLLINILTLKHYDIYFYMSFYYWIIFILILFIIIINKNTFVSIYNPKSLGNWEIDGDA